MTEFSPSYQGNYLVADMGGTHTDIAIHINTPTISKASTQQPKTLPSLIKVKRFLSQEFTDPKEVITTYLNHYKTPSHLTHRLTHFFLALASPLHQDHVNYTHTPWQFSQHALRHAFPAPVTLLNDFEALAYSLPYLNEKDLVCLQQGHSPLKRAGQKRKEIISLLGPGTGLGSATIVQQANTPPLILPNEGGQTFFTPRDNEELTLLELIKKEKKLWPKDSSSSFLTWEELLSGKQGIPRLIKAMSLLYKKEANFNDAPTLIKSASHQNIFAQQVLDRYTLLLASACQNLALQTGSQGGLYLAGGVIPHFLTKLKKELFTQRFSQHPLMAEYLKAIPLYVLIHPYPTLIGLQAFSQL